MRSFIRRYDRASVGVSPWISWRMKTARDRRRYVTARVMICREIKRQNVKTAGKCPRYGMSRSWAGRTMMKVSTKSQSSRMPGRADMAQDRINAHSRSNEIADLFGEAGTKATIRGLPVRGICVDLTLLVSSRI